MIFICLLYYTTNEKDPTQKPSSVVLLKEVQSMNDGKTKYKNTAKYMQEALFQLLTKKEFASISVKEICEQANVNRSTFYDHYQNTYELLQEAVNQSIYEFTQALKVQTGNTKNILQKEGNFLISTKYLVPYLQFIKDNKVMFRAYISNSHIFPVSEYGKYLIKNVFTPVCMDNGIVDPTIINYMSKYYLTGVHAIVAEWVKNDCKDDILLIVEVIILCVGLRQKSQKDHT